MKNNKNIQRRQKAFNEDECEKMIKDALEYMGNVGHDFCYSSRQPFQQKPKQMLRKVYLRYNCVKCKKNGKPVRWTSICGTVIISFELKEIQQKRENPFLVIFKFKIFGMKCQKCGQYGQAQIYDSQLQKIQRGFCKIIGQILNGVPPKRKKRNENPKQVPYLQNHLVSLCQACKLNKCSSLIRY